MPRYLQKNSLTMPNMLFIKCKVKTNAKDCTKFIGVCS